VRRGLLATAPNQAIFICYTSAARDTARWANSGREETSELIAEKAAKDLRRGVCRRCTWLSTLACMSPTLSEEQYTSKLRLISAEIENAFIMFHTYEELNRLAHHDSSLLAVLNADALFWNTYRNNLVTNLFMTTSRLFDPVAAATTVQTVVTATLRNLRLFSKEALRIRKTGKGPVPRWLDEFMEKVWVPTEPWQLTCLSQFGGVQTGKPLRISAGS
jgi:hypothetical protein